MLAHVVILPYGGEGRRIRSSKSSLDYYEQHKLHETLSKKGNENILIHFHSFGFSNAFLSQQHRHTPGERRLLRENPEQTDLGAHREEEQLMSKNSEGGR